MNVRPAVAASVVALSLTSCAAQDNAAESDGTWVGTITTEGDVTTVVNESGSVWGGTATLVEEASIGVESGADEYLLGRVAGLAFDANRIYVLDSQVPALRLYDHEGRYIASIGGEGQGPGEFTLPNSLAVGDDGRIFLRDENRGRINVYGAEGEVIDTLAIAANFGTDRQDVAAHDGIVYTPVRIGGPDLTESLIGMQGFRPDGSTLEPIVPPQLEYQTAHVVVRRGRGMSTLLVPFAPRYVWSMTPEGAWVVGVADSYRFAVRHQDGRQQVVQRLINPVAVHPDEHDYYAGVLRSRIQRAAGDDGTVEGRDPDDVPGVKPFFFDFIPGHDGRIWVLREGPSERGEDCGENEEPGSCWLRTVIVDAFDADGRFLGEIELPEALQLSPPPALRDDTVVASFEDEAGTIMVKRYRLVPPGER